MTLSLSLATFCQPNSLYAFYSLQNQPPVLPDGCDLNLLNSVTKNC